MFHPNQLLTYQLANLTILQWACLLECLLTIKHSTAQTPLPRKHQEVSKAPLLPKEQHALDTWAATHRQAQVRLAAGLRTTQGTSCWPSQEGSIWQARCDPQSCLPWDQSFAGSFSLLSFPFRFFSCFPVNAFPSYSGLEERGEMRPAATLEVLFTKSYSISTGTDCALTPPSDIRCTGGN